jgi:hypothetical protein
MNRRPRPTLLAALCAASLSAFAQPHRVVRLSAPDVPQPSEVSIAINPTNPNNLVAVSLQYRQPGAPTSSSNVAYVSTDGGRTWKTVPTANPRLLRQGDDSVAFDASGTAYHAYISFDGIRVERPKRAVNGIQVVASKDGGLTWADPVPVIDHVNTVAPFEDKPYVVTDNVPGSPHRNNVYLAWTRFDAYGSKDPACQSHIYFSRSDDGARTFAMPIRISDAPGDCVDSDNTVEGAVAAAGVGGEVYVVWSGPQGIVFDKSTDGGLTFGKDRLVTRHVGGWDIPVPGNERHNGMPVTKVDYSAGPGRGTVYVNFIDERNGDPDVLVIASRDGGETWSQAVRVNDDQVGNGRAQMFTWMAVDPADGSINVVFHDRRDLDGTRTGVTLARSVDGGRTFVNYRVNQPPFDFRPGVFFGDYNGIDAFGGLVAAVYPHLVGEQELAVSAALFRFKPGTQELLAAP